MGIRMDADFSDVDGFFEDEQWNVQKKMIDVGADAVRYAEDNGTYQDHTLRLRTSNDYDVTEDALILTNSAPYASYVESKGYDVLSGAALFAQRELKKEFEQ